MELSRTPESRDMFRRREIMLAVADYQCYVDNISTVSALVETEIMTEMIDQGCCPPMHSRRDSGQRRNRSNCQGCVDAFD